MTIYLAQVKSGMGDDETKIIIQQMRDQIIATEGAEIRHDLTGALPMIYFTVRDTQVLETLRLSANANIHIREQGREHDPAPKP